MAADFTLVLCDTQQELARAWRRAFAALPEVQIHLGDLLDMEADAYVSPANSYGIMDGGIDAVLSARFPQAEARVQVAIEQGGGLLPVGQAVVVETGDRDVPYLVCAPTMQVPSRVGQTDNASRAMLALLRAVAQFNAVGEDVIDTVAAPGLCTGVGAMEPDTAAHQMAQAYAQWRADHAPREASAW